MQVSEQERRIRDLLDSRRRSREFRSSVLSSPPRSNSNRYQARHVETSTKRKMPSPTRASEELLNRLFETNRHLCEPTLSDSVATTSQTTKTKTITTTNATNTNTTTTNKESQTGNEHQNEEQKVVVRALGPCIRTRCNPYDYDRHLDPEEPPSPTIRIKYLDRTDSEYNSSNTSTSASSRAMSFFSVNSNTSSSASSRDTSFFSELDEPFSRTEYVESFGSIHGDDILQAQVSKILPTTINSSYELYTMKDDGTFLGRDAEQEREPEQDFQVYDDEQEEEEEQDVYDEYDDIHIPPKFIVKPAPGGVSIIVPKLVERFELGGAISPLSGKEHEQLHLSNSVKSFSRRNVFI